MAPRRVLRILVVKYATIGTDLYIHSTTLKPLAELVRRGHQVTFFAPTISKSAQKGPVPGFLKLVQLRKRVPILSLLCFEFAALGRLLRSIASSDAIILDFNSVPMLFPVLLLRRLCSPTPILLLHIETNVLDVSPLRSAFLYFIDALSAKLASILFDKILFSSPMLADLYRQMYGIPAGKVAVWPNVVETNFAESADELRTSLLRKELGLTGRIGFLYHGAVSRTRGIIELVEAFRILSTSSENVTLVLLGYGAEKEAISRYIREHNLDGIVKLRGPVDHSEVPTYIAACDVGITPLPDLIEHRYQCPIKVLEVLAMNKPLIVSDIPAHRWIIGDEPVAFYLKGTNAFAIAEGIRRFLTSGVELDPTLGEEIVRKRFTPEKIADILEHQILTSEKISKR